MPDSVWHFICPQYEDTVCAISGAANSVDSVCRILININFPNSVWTIPNTCNPEDVEFPSGHTARQRKAYGRNGVGHHGLLCFGDEYRVETWRTCMGIYARVCVLSKLPVRQ